MLWGKQELEFVQEDVFLGIKLCGVSCPPSLPPPPTSLVLLPDLGMGTGEVQRRKIIGLIIMLPALKLISRICKNLLDLNSGKKDELTNTILRCRVEGNHSQIVYFSKSFVLILFWQNIKIFINYSYFINVVIAVCHQPS